MSKEKMTGYPSIDKPWLKCYSDEAINAPLPEGTIYEYMVGRNSDRLDAVALNYFGKKITYRKLNRMIDRCAAALLAQGVERGELVSICTLSVPEAIALFYAINKIGAISNFVALNASMEEIHQQLLLAESKIVFALDFSLLKIAAAAKNTKIEKIIEIQLVGSMPTYMKFAANLKNKPIKQVSHITWKNFISSGKETLLPEIQQGAADIAVLEYTSGTTAEAKGVMLSNKAINSVAFQYDYARGLLNFNEGDKMLNCVPPFLAFGLIFNLHVPLAMGFQLILSPDPSPQLMPKNVLKYRPNHLITAPVCIESLIKDKKVQKADLSFLKTIAYGGDTEDENWEKRSGDFFLSRGAAHGLLCGYGLTETSSTFCTSTHRTDKMLPFVKNNVKIIDVDSGKELSYDCEGEICLTGPSLMSGYYKRPDATEEAFFETDGMRWLHTGDLGMVTHDGFICITGRLKRIFWAKGADGVISRVYPMKIEEKICALLGVEQCAVVGVPNMEKGYLTIVYVVVGEGVCIDKSKLIDGIKALCEREFSAASQPDKINIISELPITRAGKVDYRRLEDEAKKLS